MRPNKVNTAPNSTQRRATAPKAAEKKLQLAIEVLVKNGQLLDTITGKEEPQEVIDLLRSEEWIATFPVDYLIRKRTAVAAQHVLTIMDGLTQVSSANRSISLTVGEPLFPDLLGVNAALASLATLELKADYQTERQAVTELLAYDHEIRNHLPFLSSNSLGLVVIATEFSSLLDHAIASLITWQRRSVLCLRARFEGNKLQLNVHLPSRWAPLGQSVLPPGAIRVGMLRIVPLAGETRDDVESVALSALQLVSREAERAGSHGFILLSNDHFYPKASNSPCFFLVGLLDPFAFLRNVSAHASAIKLEAPFAEFLRGDQGLKLSQSDAPFEWLRQQAMRCMEEYAELQWDGFCTWDEERSPLGRFQGTYQLPMRSSALYMESWGNIGKYLEDMVLHPAVRNLYLPYVRQPGSDWTFPPTAIQILDWMAVPSLFPNGRLTCRGFFHVGMRLGRLLSAYQSCEKITNGNYLEMPHRLVWLREDLVDALREIICRHSSSDAIPDPPKLTLGGPEHATASREVLTRELEWLRDAFIGAGFPIQQYLLQIGVNAHVLFDPYFWSGTLDDYREKLQDLMVSASLQYLHACVDFIFDKQGDKAAQARVRRMLLERYAVEASPEFDLELTKKLLETVDIQTHIQRFEDTLLLMIDEWVPAVWHPLNPIAEGGVDWDWLRNQVDALRAQGIKIPGITLWPSGEIAVSMFDRVVLALPRVTDPTTEVLVCRNDGVEVYCVRTWNELKEGALSRE